VEDSKEKAAARIKSLIQSIVSALITEDRIVYTLAIRKGRRLLVQLMKHCDKDACFKMMQAVLRNLTSLSKKEPSLEMLAVVKIMFDLKLTGLNETEWSQLWELINPDFVENIVKYKLGSALILYLIQRSAVDNVELGAGSAKVVERWASVTYSNVTSSNKDAPARIASMEKNQVDQLSSWLRNVAGASIPPSVVDAIETSLLADPKT